MIRKMLMVLALCVVIPTPFVVHAAPKGMLSVTPAINFSSSGCLSGSFNPSYQYYTLTNTGGSPLDWTASKTQPWLGLIPSKGTLAAGASATVRIDIMADYVNSIGYTLKNTTTFNDTVSFLNTTSGFGNTTRSASLTVSLPVVTVTATDNTASEAGDRGTYTISRTGSTIWGWQLPVYFKMGGSAEPGIDYPHLYSPVYIPEGRSSVEIILTPLYDTLSEGTETATLTLLENPNYLTSPTSATATISILDGGCSYPINKQGASYPSSGGSGSITISAPAGCRWTATSSASWITITGGPNFTGKNTVNYTVAANASPYKRAGNISIAGHDFSVLQDPRTFIIR